MFKLDQAIANWRRQMVAAGVKSPASLDELESHLREDVERQTRLGTPPETAFELAMARIGEPTALKAEFAKIRRTRSAMEKVRIAVAALLGAVITFLSVAAYFLCYTTLGDRLVMAAAVVCILSVARYWPLAIPYLPMISAPRKRNAVALTCILAGVGISTLIAQVFMPHYIHPDENMTPTFVFWTIFPFTVGLGLGCGIDRRGYGAVDTDLDSRGEPGVDQFTDLAQAALEQARKEAMRLNHDFIGTEHVLLGIIASESGLLMDVLRHSLIDAETVRFEIEKLVGMNPLVPKPGDAPYTPRAKRAFQFAAKEARGKNQTFITAEHLFLGLLLENEGVAGLVLRKLGFDFEKARAHILEGFGPGEDHGANQK
jgi:hypothetical protein